MKYTIVTELLNNAWLRYLMVREFPYVFSDYCIYFTEKP